MSFFSLFLGFLAGLLIAALALSGASCLEPRIKRNGPRRKALQTALARISSGDHAAAAASLRQAAEMASGDDTHFLLLGDQLRRSGDHSRAERVVEILLARRDLGDELRSSALLLKGRLLETAGLTDQALDAYSEAVRLQPNESPPLVAQGRLLSRERRWREAIESSNRLARIDPERAKLIRARRRTLLATELVAEGSPKDALKEARQAVDDCPTLAAAHMTLGDAQFQLSDAPKARESWQEAGKLASWLAPQILDRLEQISRVSGERDALHRFARDAAEHDDPDDPPWRLFAWLADDALRLDAIEEARSWCGRLVEVAPFKASTVRLEARLAAAEDGMRAGPRQTALLTRWENDPVWIDPWHCRVCGHQAKQLAWRCQNCQAWESLR